MRLKSTLRLKQHRGCSPDVPGAPSAPADTVSRGSPSRSSCQDTAPGGSRSSSTMHRAAPWCCIDPDTAGAGDHLFTLEEAVCKFEVLHWRSCNVPCDCWNSSPEGLLSNCLQSIKQPVPAPCPVAALLQASLLDKCPW